MSGDTFFFQLNSECDLFFILVTSGTIYQCCLRNEITAAKTGKGYLRSRGTLVRPDQRLGNFSGSICMMLF